MSSKLHLSVIIPTAGRPEWLPRAVDSALAVNAANDTEVIVVPNGADNSWKSSLLKYRDNPSVRVLPVDTGHACVARNHGMRHSRGQYIRFLDDDDILYAEGARRQLLTMERTGADIASGNVDLADANGVVFREWCQDAQTDDFVASSCSHRRMLQMTAHVFRRTSIIGVPWDESLPYSQDICWILDLVAKKEVKWVKVDTKVGCWNRHVDMRISTSALINKRRMLIAERLRHTAAGLAITGRLTPDRRAAIASGAWEQFHDAFYLSPLYWLGIARWISAFCPGSHPAAWLYESTLLKRLPISPIVWEVLTCPRQMANHAVKILLYKSGLARRW